MPRVIGPLLVLVLTACAPSTGASVVAESPDGRFEQVGRDAVRIWRHVRPSGDGLAALVFGALGYDPDCGAYLDNDEVELRYPVVWPAGTAITGTDPVTLRLPSGATVAVGQVVSGGGGYHSGLGLFEEHCSATGEAAVFNASEPVDVG